MHGSLLSQADRVVDLIYTKYLKGIISYQNITGVETYPYPKEAIREAVLNAISHKNYATLVPIQIRVYDNQIMVANDCVFPGDWTVDDLLGAHKSRPYNPLIANTFFRAGFIEAWGRGIPKKDSCILAGNNIPEYKVKREDITITFKSLYNKNTQDKNLTDKERQILRICKEEKSKQENANLMGYRTIKSIKPDVESLVNKGKLKMSIPDKPKSKNQKYLAPEDKNMD